MSISVRLSSAPRAPIGISIRANAGGTAERGDFTILGLSEGTLSFSPGQLLKSFTIAADHDSDRDNETILLGFGALPQGVSVGSVRITTITIIDEDVASDTGGSSRRGISARNSPPRFIERHNAIRSIAENSPPGTEVGEPVAATDADRRDQDSLTYSLAGVDVNSFSINSASGQILTDALLDFERKAGYRVVVLVRDGRGGNDIISVSIVVTDINEPPLVSGAASIGGHVNMCVNVIRRQPSLVSVQRRFRPCRRHPGRRPSSVPAPSASGTCSPPPAASSRSQLSPCPPS